MEQYTFYDKTIEHNMRIVTAYTLALHAFDCRPMPFCIMISAATLLNLYPNYPNVVVYELKTQSACIM